MTRKILLACGVVAFVYYVALDTLAAALYPGYSWSSQAISELSAIGAPTAGLWAWLGPIYSFLALAFAWGVWQSAGRNRPLRIVAILLFALSFVGLFWPIGAMHRRELVAAGGATWTDTMHIVISLITVPLNLLIVGFGAAALGKGFRWFSIATLAGLLVFGTLMGMVAPELNKGHPTPLLGLWERILVFGYMAWAAVLAINLMRESRAPAGATEARADVRAGPRPAATRASN